MDTTRDRSTPRLSVGVGAAVALMLVAGCGGSEEPEDEAPTGTEETATDDMDDMDMENGDDTGDDDTSGEDSDGDDGLGDDVVITIADFSYDMPDPIPAGSTITVVNEDDVGHTVTSVEEGIFDVVVGPGEEAEFTVPDDPGEYPFHCTPHPTMTDTLVVE